jgi:predicted HicB family RNase H-like nuclease
VKLLPPSKNRIKEPTSIKVNPDLWKEAKIEAIKCGKTLSEVVEEALEDWVRNHTLSKEKRS